MKKLLPLLFALIACNASAQLGAKIYYLAPAGELAEGVKPIVTGEILYLESFDDDPTRFRAGFTYIPFKMRMDTFPVYAVTSGSNGTVVLPGFQTFRNYTMYFLSFGMDYALVDKEPLYVYPGADIIIGGVDKDYDLVYETYKSESFSGGIVQGGIRLRVGAEYMFSDNIGGTFEIATNFYLTEESSIFNHSEFGLGVHFIFN